MRRYASFFIPMVLLPLHALGASPFDGAWEPDLKSVQYSQTAPSRYELANGSYKCFSCDPAVDVKADGTDQVISGNPQFDGRKVEAVNEHTVRITDTQRGKLYRAQLLTVSPDGGHWKLEINGTAPIPFHALAEFTRAGNGPTGSHLISGSWKPQTTSTSAPEAGGFTITVTRDAVVMKNASSSFNAKFDGKEYPDTGAPAGSTVTVRRLDERSIEETDRERGKITYVGRFTISGDAKKMDYVLENKRIGGTTKMTFVRTQSSVRAQAAGK